MGLGITFDPAKRAKRRAERGLDFADAADVFSGVTIDIPDDRFKYGETRIISVGHLQGRMVIIVWVDVGHDTRRIISMRKANNREKAASRSDLAKMDAHVIRQEDYNDIPEVIEEMLSRGTIMESVKPARRSRPPTLSRKEAIKLRLDADVLAHSRETGSGWQTRINLALRRAAGLGEG